MKIFFSAVSGHCRRVLVIGFHLSILFATLLAGNAAAPPAAILQAGDLVWPKKPGAIVPYNSRPGEADQSDEARWRREKEVCLEQIRRNPDPSAEEKERFRVLQKMTYKGFLAYYLADRNPGEISEFGIGNVAVGHVGIIEIADGKPFVVEAMVGPGVQRLSYADWVQQRPEELIWVGRLIGVDPDKRAAVAEKAVEQLGKPYRFWDFDLADTTGFYCSKLAWLSILQGAGFPPDDNSNPKRWLWYSPKQLMNSKHIELIVNPGDYATLEQSGGDD